MSSILKIYTSVGNEKRGSGRRVILRGELCTDLPCVSHTDVLILSILSSITYSTSLYVCVGVCVYLFHTRNEINNQSDSQSLTTQ